MSLLPRFNNFNDLFSNLLTEMPIGKSGSFGKKPVPVSGKQYYATQQLKSQKIPEKEWQEYFDKVTSRVLDEVGKHLDENGDWEGSDVNFYKQIMTPIVYKVVHEVILGAEKVEDPHKFSKVVDWNSRTLLKAMKANGDLEMKKKPDGKVVVHVDTSDDAADSLEADPSVKTVIAKTVRMAKNSKAAPSTTPRGIRFHIKNTYEVHAVPATAVTDEDAKAIHMRLGDEGEKYLGKELIDDMMHRTAWAFGKVASALNTLIAAGVLKIAEPDVEERPETGPSDKDLQDIERGHDQEEWQRHDPFAAQDHYDKYMKGY